MPQTGFVEKDKKEKDKRVRPVLQQKNENHARLN